MTTASPLPLAGAAVPPVPAPAPVSDPVSDPVPAAASVAPRPLPPLQARRLPPPVALVPLAPSAVLLGIAGYVALPLVGMLGGPAAGTGSAVAAVAPPVAALFLSVPSLLTGHQFLGLHAAPADLVRDIGHVFVGCGRLALGLVPMVALYSATTRLGGVAMVLSMVALGLTGVELARRRLIRREAAAAAAAGATSFAGRTRMDLLAVGWSLLALLIAARMGIELLVQL